MLYKLRFITDSHVVIQFITDFCVIITDISLTHVVIQFIIDFCVIITDLSLLLTVIQIVNHTTDFNDVIQTVICY